MIVILYKKKAKLIAGPSDKKLFTLISVFAGDAVIGNKKSFLRSLGGILVGTLNIDLTHNNITKEFIQLLMRYVKR